jgi:prepilin-type N-terminal cleavage/methylation domain-containing protein
VKIGKNKQSAFTLVEMILAIGVSAIALIAVNAVLFTALHLRESTTAAVDASLPVDQTVTFLRRDLECTVTPTNGTSKYLSGSFKLGNISSPGMAEPVAAEIYTATGALGVNAPWADIQRVTYGLKNSLETSGRTDLYRSVTRNLLATSTQEITEQLMLRDVESVKFSGYDGAQWLEMWDTSDITSTTTNLPLAVRVEIQLTGGSSARLEPIRLVVPIDSVMRTNMVFASSSTTSE